MNYIGSKYTLLLFLEQVFREVCDGSERVLCDIFAGTGAVGRLFKHLGLQVIANDIQYYSYALNLLTAMSHGGVNDPLQRSRLKIQFAFCLGIRYASHLSPVVNRIRTTRFQSILNRYLRRWWSIQPLSKRREPFAHR